MRPQLLDIPGVDSVIAGAHEIAGGQSREPEIAELADEIHGHSMIDLPDERIDLLQAIAPGGPWWAV